MRWDLDGDGDVDSSANETSYRAAFAGSIMAEDMGCLDGPDVDQEGDCAGYELMADLDFDTDRDGDVDSSDDYPNWSPIGGTYSATFDGNNRVISNLTIVDAAGSAGLFNTVSGTVRGLGLADVDVSGVGGSSTQIAPLAAEVNGTVIASWASGRVRVGSSGLTRAGGLVGRVSGSGSRLAASYSTASVTGAGSSASYAGGLSAVIHNGATVVACYATGLVDEGGSGSVRAGGLIGNNVGPTTVRASYFAGTVAGSGVNAVTASNDGSGENYYNVYYDSGTTGQTAGAAAQTTSALQGPTSATGTLYAAWDDLDVNGNGTADEDPWDFGSAYNHPALNYGGLDPASQRTDYDADDDGLIEISTLQQLNALRWDVDGDGAPSSGNESNYHAFRAFFNPRLNPGGAGLCPTTAADADDDDCAGYELLNDLDFDTDGDGDVDGNDPNTYANWTPVPGWASTLDGGGHVIEHLTVSGAGNDRGLFATATTAATVRSLGLVDVSVTGSAVRLAALAGVFNGRIAAVYSTGTVRGAGGVGGLVAEMRSSSGRIVASYSAVDVECTANQNWARAGALVSRNDGVIAASYATGEITGNCPTEVRGGLASVNNGTAPASYWDTDLTKIADDTDDPPQPPEGRTTAVLQAPTGYDTIVGDPGEAIYAAWDEQDVDGDGATGDGGDADPWDFGRPNQHPILKYAGLAAAPQLDAQPDTAPAFSGTVDDMTLPGNVAVSFQVPAATAGNGAYRYAASGLPTGLSFGLPDCADERTVCGAPTAASTGTVTVTVSDSDSNMAANDRDTLTFMATVPAASASIASTTPTALTETNLNGATLRIELSGTVFVGGFSPASFQLATTPTIAGLSIASATRASDTEATLTLRFDGTNFDTQSMLLVRVLAAAHRFGGDQDTGAVAVAPAGGVMLSATTLALEEDPGTTNANVGTYTVVLAGQPAGTVTVRATSGNPDVTVDPGTLTFDGSSWNIPTFVTVTAGQDDDAVDDVAHVTHAVQGVPGVASGPRVRVTVNDKDAQGLTLDAATLAGSGVAEGMAATYTVRLASEPTGPVTVAIASSEGAVTVDADAGAAGAQNTLLFHAMNWNAPQTATVRAAEDDDGESESVTLSHDPSGADYGDLDNVDVSFAVADNDAKGATLSTTALNVQENGAATYALVLDTQPVGGPVSVAVASATGTVATARPATLTFTAGNWDAPQTVTVSGVDDTDTADESETIGHTPTGGGYDGVAISDVTVTAVDDDVAGLKVSPVDLTVAEGGTATYAVRLNVAPTAAVSVQVVSNSLKAAVDTDSGTSGDQSTLSFDAANWDTARTVTVTGAEDADGADETVGLTHAVTGTGDYAALAAIRRPGVAVLVRDDEAAGVVLSPSSLAVDEGGTATYDVELSAPPATGAVTVTVAATGMAGLTTDASALSFTTTTWDAAQTVTVTAVADHARLEDAQGALTHAVAGYGAVESGPDLPVTVRNATVDYDADADGLIEIGSLAQLNAMRWDLDGDGTASSGNAASYAAAFPTPRGGGVCPTATSGTACRGFELTADLDFDTDGDGRTWTETGGDDGDDYYNGGLGWEPVGTAANSFTARFDGNGRLLRNLFVNRASNYAGLFGSAIPNARIEAVGLPNARVTAGRGVGALVGRVSNGVRVAASWSTGSVSGTAHAGGLVGETQITAEILASYSTAAVECAGTGNNATAGGLAGGQLNNVVGIVEASWSAGAVTGACPYKDGLVGGGTTATASYWDATASRIPDDADLDPPEGLSTAALQAPTRYAGIYASWNLDLDGDYEADDPWDFGSSSQYPSLKWRAFDPARQFAVPQPPPPTTAPNRAPYSTGALRDVALPAGGELAIDLGPAFRDPDADALSYRAWSSHPEVATAVAVGRTLRLAAAAAGGTEIGVRATDPGGLSATARFHASVGVSLSLIGDAAAPEGGAARLAARLSAARRSATAFRWRVAADADPATADADAGEHGDASGTASIAAGRTETTLRIAIADDADIEPAREWFEVVLEAPAADAGWELGRARAKVAVEEGVCDRTPAVRDALRGDGACGEPTPAALAAVSALAVSGAPALAAGDFAGLAGLRWLSLAGNGLPELPAGLFAGLGQLRTLDLSANRLAALAPGTFADAARLRVLLLDGNAFETLPAGLFAGLSNLREASLADNPGAPFALAAELARTDAAAGAPGPATVAPRIASGAPFPVRVGLTATPAAAVAGALPPTAEIAAGAVDGTPFRVAAVAGLGLDLRAGTLALPRRRCGEEWPFAPCFRGFEAAPGGTLSLFARPPRALPAPEPTPLFGDALRIPLAALVRRGDAPGRLRWRASSSEESVATVAVRRGTLVVEPEPGAEGETTIEVVATDSAGRSATVRFRVAVEFRPPNRRTGGWRSAAFRDAAR